MLSKVLQSENDSGRFPLSLGHTDGFYAGKRLWMRGHPSINQFHGVIGRCRVYDEQMQGEFLLGEGFLFFLDDQVRVPHREQDR